MATLALESVRKSFGTLEVVHGIDLAVKDCEFIVLVGPSGCGKSTILRMIAGLEDVTAGLIRIDGQVVNEREPKERDIAMVFQDYALYPHMTVFENMGFGLRYRGHRRADIRARVDAAARILDIVPLLERMPRELSGGQRQRVAMGRAIVRDPKIFLFDEPLSNLDAKLRDDLRGEIRDIQTRLGITALFVTHDQAEALTMSDRIAVMNRGRIEQIGTPADIYERPASLFVANFVGRANQFAAVAEDTNILAGAGLRVRAPVGLTRGQETTVIVRPHRMRLSRSSVSDEINEVQATIRRVVFAGDVVHTTLEGAGTTLLVESPTFSSGASPFAVGETVFVQWPISDTLVFARP